MVPDESHSNKNVSKAEEDHSLGAFFSDLKVIHQPPCHPDADGSPFLRSRPLLSLLANGDSGLQILTPDQHAHHQATASVRCLPVTYRVQVNRKVDEALLCRLKRGVTDYGDFLAASSAAAVQSTEGDSLEITLHRDRAVTVRRLFAAFGISVRSVHRLAIGPVHLGNLAPDQQRSLSAAEIETLTKR